MPNWCEGSLKLRGKTENIMRFINEGLNVYTGPAYSELLDKKDWLEIIDNGKELEIYFNHDTIYVEDTKRAFINLEYSKICHKNDVILTKDDDDQIAVFDISQAWGFRNEDWLAIAEKYDLNIKLYGIEQGMGFVEDLLICDHGKTMIDNSPNFYDYKDFLWNCPLPWFGG